MKIALEMYVTVTSLVIGLMLLLQVFGMNLQMVTASTYSRKYVCQIENENLSTGVVERSIEEAEQLGYELSYREVRSTILGCATCSYVFGEYDPIDSCSACGSVDVIDVERKYGELKLKYNLAVPILGINKENYIMTYVH